MRSSLSWTLCQTLLLWSAPSPLAESGSCLAGQASPCVVRLQHSASVTPALVPGKEEPCIFAAPTGGEQIASRHGSPSCLAVWCLSNSFPSSPLLSSPLPSSPHSMEGRSASSPHRQMPNQGKEMPVPLLGTNPTSTRQPLGVPFTYRGTTHHFGPNPAGSFISFEPSLLSLAFYFYFVKTRLPDS